MELSSYYSYYFNNGGVCPTCNHLLTLHFGCTNVGCKDCIKQMEEDDIFSKRAMGYHRKREKEKERYYNFVKRVNARRKKKLDKCQEKKYADVEHSGL